jgi:MtN3 and saliva related transmembrane protein
MTRDLLGYAAATLTTLAFLPQVVKVWRSRSARDISLPMYGLFVAGVALWVVYGVLIHSSPVIYANVATFLLSATVLLAKVCFGGED